MEVNTAEVTNLSKTIKVTKKMSRFSGLSEGLALLA